MGAIEVGMLNKILQDLKNVGEPAGVPYRGASAVAAGSTVAVLSITGASGKLFAVACTGTGTIDITITVDGTAGSTFPMSRYPVDASNNGFMLILNVRFGNSLTIVASNSSLVYDGTVEVAYSLDI